MSKKKMTPPLTDEAMESKLISLALVQAQKQLEDGTASSQMITHFLRLGSQRNEIELKKIELETKYLEEKILSEKQGQQLRSMFEEVLKAIQSYNYTPPEDVDFVDLY